MDINWKQLSEREFSLYSPCKWYRIPIGYDIFYQLKIPQTMGNSM